jgi:hypothetical protein
MGLGGGPGGINGGPGGINGGPGGMRGRPAITVGGRPGKIPAEAGGNGGGEGGAILGMRVFPSMAMRLGCTAGGAITVLLAVLGGAVF